jgi:Ring hydroxylating alpha subunit (catalytic domain).
MALARCTSPPGRSGRWRRARTPARAGSTPFLTFYGPGGFATPDDVEALELVQQGLANWADDRWSEMSRGMGKEGEQLNSDEHHLRIFWRRWNELMGAQT